MFQDLDRRRFMRHSATAAAATGLVAFSQDARSDDEAGKRVVVGVMGLRRGRSLASSFAAQSNVVVKYLCDVDAEAAEKCARMMAQSYEIKPQIVADFRRILDDPEIDALVCAAPNHWHAPATIMACVAGKDVYVEKPCSHNPREGQWMVDAARKYGRLVQVGTQRRSAAGTIRAIEQLHAGAIGRLYLARAWYHSARGTIGRGNSAPVPPHLDYGLWQGPAPRKPYIDNRIPYNWHWFWHWGNGELGNNGVHTIDLCRWGLGVDYPVQVTSSGGRYAFDDDQETPDTHTVAFEFDGDKQITWQGLSCNPHGTGFVAFYGEDGALDLQSNGTYTIYDRKGNKVRGEPGQGHGQTEHVANFLTAIRNRRPEQLNTEIAEGHRSTLLCHLGNMAHRVRRTLRCHPQDGRVLDDAQAMQLWSRQYEPGWEPSLA